MRIAGETRPETSALLNGARRRSLPTTLGGLALLLGVVGLASVVAVAAGCLLYIAIRLGERRRVES